MTARTLVVGIGSHHGDDQAGWRMAERLQDSLPSCCEVRLARSPVQLLDWLEGHERLVICDACHRGAAPGSAARWTWPCAALSAVRFSGTHDLSLVATLQLAERLDRLPDDVVIWTVDAAGHEHATPVDAGIHPSVLKGVTAAAARIVAELRSVPSTNP